MALDNDLESFADLAEQNPALDRRAFLTAIMGVALAGCSRKQEDPSAQRNATKSAAEKVINPPETVDGLRIGNFALRFDPSIPEAEKKRMSTLFERVSPVIARFVPPSHNSSADQITFLEVGEDAVSVTSPATGKIALDHQRNEGVEVHELIHALKGNGFSKVQFVEEGTTGAITRLASKELGFEPEMFVENMQVSPSLQEGGMALNGSVPYRVFPPLMMARLYFASKLWLDLEKKHPGIIKRTLAEIAPYGGEAGDLNSQGRVAGKALSGDFKKVALGNPLMRVIDTHNKPLIYASYTNTGGMRYLLFSMVRKQERSGVENPVRDQVLQYRFINSKTGKSSSWENFETSSDPFSTKQVDLFDDRNGFNLLPNTLGESDRYKVELKCDALGAKEDFEFEYI
ncbi:MAG: hypothetical protein WCX95_00275 [Candidatus Gracilibacteria bacterium]